MKKASILFFSLTLMLFLITLMLLVVNFFGKQVDMLIITREGEQAYYIAFAGMERSLQHLENLDADDFPGIVCDDIRKHSINLSGAFGGGNYVIGPHPGSWFQCKAIVETVPAAVVLTRYKITSTGNFKEATRIIVREKTF